MVPKDPSHWQDPVWPTTDAQSAQTLPRAAASGCLLSDDRNKVQGLFDPVLKSSADVQHLNNELCFQGQCQEFGFYVYGKDQTPQQVIWVLLKIVLKR